MCTIKNVDAIYHDYLMTKNAFSKSEKSLDGHLSTRSKEQLERIIKHAQEKSKPILLEKAQEALAELMRYTSV